MYLTLDTTLISVSFAARVMIAQWELGGWTYLTVCPLHGRVQFPAVVEYLKGFFPWVMTFYQPVWSQCGRRWLNLPSMTPQNLWSSRPTMDR